MRLIRASEDFKLHNQSYEGFPLLVDSDMELVRVAHKFLVYYCITRGRVQSRNSWWKYGQVNRPQFASVVVK